MGSVTLSKILRRETRDVVSHVLRMFGTPVAVLGPDGEPLVTTGSCSAMNRVPVALDGEILGWVSGDGCALPVAALVGLLAKQEQERRELGRETLERYKEIHLLYRMGERISQRLDLHGVAELVVDEALRSIPATGASVMLLSEDDSRLEIVAGFGEEQACKTSLGPGRGIAGDILVTGRAEIVNHALLDPRYQPGPGGGHALLCAPLKGKDRIFGVINVSNRQAVEYTASDLNLLGALAFQAASAIENAILHEKRIRQERIRGNLERYVPSQVVDLLLDAREDVSLASESRYIAVLFSDIRDFSTTCEDLDPKDVVAHLNTYFTAMVHEIFRNHGTVNKFVGDMIVALFGAPVPLESPEKAAIRTAVAMQQRLRTLEEPWIREHFHTGIGVSAGRVVVGNIGSPQHMDYTAIGDEVNVAARLQAEAKGGQILVSRSVRDAVPDAFSFRDMGPIRVKGRRRPVETYDVMY